MRNKYCKKINKVLVPWSARSHVWRKVTKMGEFIEHQLWRQIKSGNNLFWYDSWTSTGSVYHASVHDHWCDESIIHTHDVVNDEQWNEDMPRDHLPQELVEHILENIQPPQYHGLKEKPWWQLESKGHFLVKSAWQYIRKRRQEKKLYKFIWVNGLSFKVCFFMWRLWMEKLTLDDTVRRWGYIFPSRCWCCENPKEETLAHMFFRSPVARFIWKYFSAPAGINIEGKLLIQVINEWWRSPFNTILKEIY